jgi:hypothetical protein
MHDSRSASQSSRVGAVVPSSLVFRRNGRPIASRLALGPDMARFMGVAAMEIPVCVSETNNGV